MKSSQMLLGDCGEVIYEHGNNNDKRTLLKNAALVQERKDEIDF